jgi:hypothetical protein
MRVKYANGTWGNHCEANNLFALNWVRIKWRSFMYMELLFNAES